MPRLVATLQPDAQTPPLGAAIWSGTTLPLDGEAYHHLFTGRVIDAKRGAMPLADVFGVFPVALLVRMS